ncbi:MAG TPA: gluconate 2-dehydrogenase subunit 3 family protein [Acidobacteriaceae bacterium]|nr:gluconate 2-dehydrogenase subunit 3 family protein [Acidobacteriaceae bacterium]
MKRSFPHRVAGGEIRGLAQPGYYPEFSTLAQKKKWDETTRRTVIERVKRPPAARFFSKEEAALLQAIVDRALPQDDRDEAHTIPIVAAIDRRLFSGSIDGYRFEDMPPDEEAYRLALAAIDEMARQRFGESFVALSVHRQELILKSLHDERPEPKHPVWDRMPVKRFWAMLMGDCVGAYYSHPWAWDEVGFGGPAYPRGYMRLENGMPEPWETDEKRYEWNAPADSMSDFSEDDRNQWSSGK